jgi:hypothetical protein
MPPTNLTVEIIEARILAGDSIPNIIRDMHAADMQFDRPLPRKIRRRLFDLELYVNDQEQIRDFENHEHAAISGQTRIWWVDHKNGSAAIHAELIRIYRNIDKPGLHKNVQCSTVVQVARHTLDWWQRAIPSLLVTADDFRRQDTRDLLGRLILSNERTFLANTPGTGKLLAECWAIARGLPGGDPLMRLVVARMMGQGLQEFQDVQVAS